MHERLEKASRLIAHSRFTEAEQLCRSALKLGKDVAVARRMLALCLYNQSVLLLKHPSLSDNAERLLREAERYWPDSLDIQNNLGALLLMLGRPEEAATHLSRASALAPANISALTNLAIALEETGQRENASASLQKLALLDPRNNAAYLLRDALQAPAIPPDDAFVSHLRETAIAMLGKLAARSDLCLENPLRLPSTYFRLAYHGPANTEINRAMAAVYAKACPALLWTAPHVAPWRGPRQRIRIGIASAFLRNHSIGSVSRGFFEQLDRTGFEVIALRLGPPAQDETSLAIDRHADRVLQIDNTNLESARRVIAGLELDVLFYQDIGMEPLSYFLAFARLAPLQITWFGHPDTTGIPTIDYYVSASLYETEDAQGSYTERLAILPNTRNIAYYRQPTADLTTDSRDSFGFGEDQHIYCCPQQLFKLQPVMDRLFLGICERDPQGIIVLFEPNEAHWRGALERRIGRLSPLLKDRVRFVPSMGYERYLRFVQLCDVVLDTVTFNGYNTTLEALAVGTPAVTMAGPLQRQRFGRAIYVALGFTELVASTENEYVDKACRVAGEKAFRTYCCEQISTGLPALFEERAAVADFEALIRGILSERAAGNRT